MKRQRGRGRKPGGGGGGGGGNNHNHGNRSLESSGPDVKIRGTAAQIYEKYAQYARDAQSGGDRVRYETYLQHAEHYYRVMAATMPRERLLQQQNGEGMQGQSSPDMEGGQPSHDGGQNGEQSHHAMRSHNEPVNNDADDGDDDNDADDGDESEAARSSPAQTSAPQPQPQSQSDQDQDPDGEGDGAGRRGRRRGRRRPADGDRANAGGGAAASGGDTEARSALDSLARKQGALTGG